MLLQRQNDINEIPETSIARYYSDVTFADEAAIELRHFTGNFLPKYTSGNINIRQEVCGALIFRPAGLCTTQV